MSTEAVTKTAKSQTPSANPWSVGAIQDRREAKPSQEVSANPYAQERLRNDGFSSTTGGCGCGLPH
jgi:hypothetical protein